MKNKISDIQQIRSYLLLWFTQMISGLGSAMTAYALVIWSYTQSGLALQTALLMVCSYAPYVFDPPQDGTIYCIVIKYKK